MSNSQDLVVNLYGKDISYSDALKKMALVSKRATIEASTHFDEMGRKIEESGKTAGSGFGSNLAAWGQSGLAGIMGGIAASVTSSITSIVAEAGSKIIDGLQSAVIDYNSTIENANIGFTTMLGSGSKATAFLDKLQDFGQKTPFDTAGLITLSQQMMGYGISANKVIPTLQALGDAAAASGKTGGDGLNNIVLAFEQMSARGRVDLGDINQLTAGGVPAIKILAAAYGTSTAGILKMIHSGKLMASDALPKLTEGIEKGTSKTAALGGMMQKQSGTFQGAMSNIKDAVTRSIGTAFQPLFKIIERGAVTVQKFVSSSGFQKWAADAGRVVTKAMSLIGGAIQKVFADPAVQKAIGRLGKSLGGAFKDVGPAVSKILPNLVKFGKDALPAIIDAITGIVDKIPTLLKWWERLASGLAAAGPAIAGTIKVLSDIGGTLFNVSAAIGNFVGDAIKNFSHFVSDAQARFNGLVGFFAGVGPQLVAGLVRGITRSWGAVTSTVHGLIDLIPKVVRDALGIHSPSRVMEQLMSYVGQGAVKGLLGSVDQVKSASAKMADAVKSAFKSGNISKTTESFALANVKSGSSYLSKLADQRQTVKDRIASLRQDRTGVHDDVKSATLGAGDITSYAAPGDAVQGLAALVQKTKTFTTDLKALVKKGVSGSMLAQLVNGWQNDPDGALTTAQGLLGNPGDLRQILTLQKQLSAAAGTLGTYAGGAEYNTQINAAKGKEKVLTWRMQQGARALERTVSHDLHVHVNLSGMYAGTKESLAKSIAQLLRDEVKKGTIPKDWAKG